MTPSSSLWITVLFIATFGVGLATGYLIRPLVDPAPMGGPGPREGRDARFRDHVTAQLKLTPDQEDRFFDAMEAHRRKTRGWMDEARDSMRVKVRAETDSLKTELSELLTEEQMSRWERMMRRAMRGGPP